MHKFIISLLALGVFFGLFAKINSVKPEKLTYLKEFINNVKGEEGVYIAKMISDSEGKLIISKEKRLVAKDEVEAIFNEQNFLFDWTKKCIFIPDFAICFKESKDSIIYVSISCKQMKFVTKKRGFILDFDPAAEKIKEIIK